MAGDRTACGPSRQGGRTGGPAPGYLRAEPPRPLPPANFFSRATTTRKPLAGRACHRLRPGRVPQRFVDLGLLPHNQGVFNVARSLHRVSSGGGADVVRQGGPAGRRLTSGLPHHLPFVTLSAIARMADLPRTQARTAEDIPATPAPGRRLWRRIRCTATAGETPRVLGRTGPPPAARARRRPPDAGAACPHSTGVHHSRTGGVLVQHRRSGPFRSPCFRPGRVRAPRGRPCARRRRS
ncbi:MAG: hypothetical protein JWN00_5900 [Actinomycetia bacterium]|nr:hypothetical protein [Actinomycetes bacterium]